MMEVAFFARKEALLRAGQRGWARRGTARGGAAASKGE